MSGPVCHPERGYNRSSRDFPLRDCHPKSSGDAKYELDLAFVPNPSYSPHVLNDLQIFRPLADST